MVPEIGHFALLLALAISLTQAIVPLIGARRREPALMDYARQAALAQAACVVAAFAALVWAFVTSDFSVGIVAANSHTAKPLLYKVSGVWANHEGSMLLWVLILALFGAALAVYGRNLPAALKADALAVQGMIGFGFLAFIAFTSNPFERLDPAPLDGNGINPILQDPGLAFHPPFLYLGYVGFSMAFSFSVAALIEGKVDAAWARWVRPWVLAAWCFLTIGIMLGSFWAYYTLGWGGWWFWDPVENASFMPWLAGTALLHSALVVERRNALVSWTILLGILTFSLSLVGTFLVRSGVLTSVHAFATDPARGVFILLLLIAATGGALALYAVRMPVLRHAAPFAPVSREGALTLNNMLLMVAAGTVFLGTFYPLAIDLMTSDKISVGPPYFNLTFVPIMVPLLVAMAIGPMLKWKRSDIREALSRLKLPALAVVAIIAVVGLLSLGRGLLAVVAPAIGMGLATWLIGGSLALARLSRPPRPVALRDDGPPGPHHAIGILRSRPRPCRNGSDRCRRHRHVGVGDGSRPAAAAGNDLRARRLCCPLPRRHDGRRGKLRVAAGDVRRFAAWPLLDDAGQRAPLLPGARADDDIGRNPHEHDLEHLHHHRRAGGRRLVPGAFLLPSAGAVDLARLSDHGAWRLRFAGRPEIARRLAAIGAQAGDDFLARAHRAGGIGVAITCPDRPPH